MIAESDEPAAPRTTKRYRRSGAVVHRRIEEAARVEFARNGYVGTSLRSVALRAGVAQSVVYRQFGSKQALYDEGVFGPFVEGLQRLADQWLARLDTSARQGAQVQQIVGDVYRYLLEHRQVLEQLLVSREELPRAMVERFRVVLDRVGDEIYLLREAIAAPRERRSRAQVDVPLRALVATVLGMSVFGWIVVPNRSHEDVIEAIVEHALGGLSQPLIDHNGRHG